MYRKAKKKKIPTILKNVTVPLSSWSECAGNEGLVLAVTRPVELTVVILDDARDSTRGAHQKRLRSLLHRQYAPSLEAVSSCIEQIKLGRKSDTGTAYRKSGQCSK